MACRCCPEPLGAHRAVFAEVAAVLRPGEAAAGCRVVLALDQGFVLPLANRKPLISAGQPR